VGQGNASGTGAKSPNPIISYKNLRRLIGILGMLLPLIVWAGGALFEGLGLQRSISFYYHTNARDVFVGLLVGVSLFLITYNGYEAIDDIVTTATGTAGFGIALFPCLSSRGAVAPVGFFQLRPMVSNALHISCAGLFFVLLAVNSLFLFTRTADRGAMTRNKKRRNAVYVACGAAILAAIAALVLVQIIVPAETIDRSPVVFWLETAMLAAFGISWLVKGETIFRDTP